MSNDPKQNGKPAAKAGPPAIKTAVVKTVTGARRSSGNRGQAKRRSSPLIRALNGLLSLVMFLMIGLGGLGYWYTSSIEGPGPLIETKAFVVKREEPSNAVAQRLAAEGVISNARMFMLQYQLRWLGSKFGGKPLLIKAGDYELQPQASLREVIEVLGEGRTVLSRITVPEGLTTFQIVERVKNDRNLIGDITAMPPEGALMPDTYKFTRGMTRQAFLDMLMAKSNEFLETAWASRAPDLPLKSPAEALVMASIVEKETGKNDERNKVAAVFINRLKKPMRLQSDPTILYGLFGGQVSWGRSIYKSEIQQKTAFNTYTINGLPPTPICNPGRAALLAVLSPAKTNDLFFVADGRGGHIFTATLKEHEAAVANWRKFEKEARARDLARAQARAAAASQTVAPTATPASLPVPSAGPGVREGDAVEDEAPAAPAAPAAVPAQAPAVAGVAVRAVSTVPTAAAPAAAPQPPAAAAAQPAAAETTGIPLPTRKPKRS